MKLLGALSGPVGRIWSERAWLSVAGVLLLALTAVMRGAEHGRVEAAETARLMQQADAAEHQLVRQLAAVHAALRDARDALQAWPVAEREARMDERLRLLGRAWPGVRAWGWSDAEGRPVAGAASTSPADGAGGAPGPAPKAAAGVQPDVPALSTLHVAPPERAPGAPMQLPLVLTLPSKPGTQGAPEGVLWARLDGRDLRALLGAAADSADLQAALSVGPGWAVLEPPADGSERIVVKRTVRSPALRLDQPLEISLSRSREAVFASWTRTTQRILAGTLVLGALAGWALVAGQRRRDEGQRRIDEAQARQASEAHRLSLALHGADLALWDLDVQTGVASVNDRWSTMLGLKPGEIVADSAGWQSLLHPEDRARAAAAQEAHIAGRTPLFEATYRMRHREGHWVWVLDRGRVVARDAEGRALRMVGTHMDVSDRMHAEQALRRNEEKLAITLQSMGDGVIATDEQGSITRINDAACRLTGWRAEEAAGRPISTVYAVRRPAAAGMGDPMERVLRQGETVGPASGALLCSRDGAERRIAETLAPIRRDGGAPEGLVLVFSDVTEHHRMLQALRDREVQLRTLADALPGPLARLDRAGRYAFANAAYERWFGIRPDDMLGRRRDEVMPPGLTQRLAPLIDVALAGEEAYTDATVQTLSGPRYTLVTVLPDRDAEGVVTGVILATVDLTERKQAEQALSASEGRRRIAGRLARLGGWRLEVATRQLWLPAEIEGLLPDDQPGPQDLAVALQRVPPGPREALQAHLDACIAQAESFDLELPLRAADGRLIQVHLIGEARLGDDGQVVLVQGAMQDVTESRREQQQLRLLEASVAHLNDVVLITEAGDADGGPRIVFVNDAFERTTGWPREAVLGRSPTLLEGPLTDAAELGRIEQARRERRAVRAELQYYTREGEPCWVQVEIVPLLDAAGRVTHWVSVQRDIRERKAAEAERHTLELHLREVQKMESIGTLAGGIAHDFNNILAAILGNAALALGDLPADHPATFSVEQISRAGLRARSLVQQILTFSRREPQALHEQPLRPVVEETLDLMRATLPPGVRLETKLSAEALWVRADATQMHQVLMNLCTNAWHALPGHVGLLEVGLAGVPDAKAAHPSLDAGPPGPCVHLWVRDDGAGMDAATRERIFDPFFTTKPVGQGTGLGLSVVHGIVRGHDGAMAVDSAPGAGSTFHVVLPRAEVTPEAALPEALPPASDGAGARARGHVLYVDDDEVMRLMVQRLLQRAHYQVTACGEAAQALALVRADPAAYSVAVSDYHMPGMTGIDMARELGRVKPALPVIISSGFISEALREQARACGVAAVLQKEHTLDELAGLVGQVLAKQPA